MKRYLVYIVVFFFALISFIGEGQLFAQTADTLKKDTLSPSSPAPITADSIEKFFEDAPASAPSPAPITADSVEKFFEDAPTAPSSVSPKGGETPSPSGKAGDGVNNYDDNSPINHVDKLKGKFLLVHGSADDNVHFQNSMEMVSALVKANKQFDFFAYPDKAHNLSGGNTRLHLFIMLTDYVLKNL